MDDIDPNSKTLKPGSGQLKFYELKERIRLTLNIRGFMDVKRKLRCVEHVARMRKESYITSFGREI